MNINILEKKATEFRRMAGLSDSDPIRIKSLLTKLNVITVFKNLSDGFSGMALKVDNNRFILVNSAHSIGKQHFTICHELYHLYIQEDFTSMICQVGTFNKSLKEEYNADQFAAILLMPETAIKEIIPEKELLRDKIQLATIIRLEQYFACSRNALLYRLKELNLITNVTYNLYCKSIKKGAVEYGFPIDLYQEGNKDQTIGNYGELTRELFDKEIISESHYISLLYDLGMNEEYLNTIFDSNDEEEN
ncbi:ImmA/IrrE family metallo-endopeptidase [Elizabethkingia anophelis]|nr:ImmA/IrrE family metallo-endopeptidase [Elizabethkingia anophelis]MCT3952376.1 ImmA/IrrE family metallo-endopeptidase [Elizabethkingia anophelis]MCT3955919.1 ImmA/IrrE family metallo-endopeptidase [Elizabethkingia anophelis]MCT3987609.1 ImmA/IrrE family metallo-endopeptidase [Elizabethkingia anophelis]MCT4066151.1 ImmA/IrrE family metallo-endopeptidase [Elizabethkingia anophelis]